MISLIRNHDLYQEQANVSNLYCPSVSLSSHQTPSTQKRKQICFLRNAAVEAFLLIGVVSLKETCMISMHYVSPVWLMRYFECKHSIRGSELQSARQQILFICTCICNVCTIQFSSTLSLRNKHLLKIDLWNNSYTLYRVISMAPFSITTSINLGSYYNGRL